MKASLALADEAVELKDRRRVTLWVDGTCQWVVETQITQ